ncbi:MAG TPA: hypothetical protein VEV84_10375 [Pyrinomonadaceae bacterium]|nr:hypothetical protein [Pyrinomonadaceae bacterium]
MTAYSASSYGRLLAKTLPGSIKDDKEYDRIESIFNGLMKKGEGNLSPEEDRLFDLLADLMESYEVHTLPELPGTSPADALSFLMRENDLKQTDLVDIFGNQGNVSKILHGERRITIDQAKSLANRFKVSPVLFI